MFIRGDGTEPYPFWYRIDNLLAVSIEYAKAYVHLLSVAAGTGGRDPVPADVADDSPYPGAITGRALPDAWEDDCAKYPGNRADRRNAAQSWRSPAEEDSRSVR